MFRRFQRLKPRQTPASSISFQAGICNTNSSCAPKFSTLIHSTSGTEFTSSQAHNHISSPQPPSIFLTHRQFSSVWGERTMSWVMENIREHMEGHKDDYTFDTDDIPFLKSPEEFHKNHVRYALVTPCIKQATSSYLIDVLLDRGYHVTGVADPTANINVIQSRFKIKDASVRSEEEKEFTVNIIDHEKDPPIYIEQRPLETFNVKLEQLETFDVIFDEMPLLEIASDESVGNRMMFCHTTTFGHAAKVGGLIYLQTEGAKRYNERIELIKRIQGFYPESHFALIDSRKTPFTRQFLFLKVDHTLGDK